MTPGSNSAPRIAELRKEMYRCRGTAARARASAQELANKAWRAERDERLLADEIVRMGGKVRR